MEKKLRNLGWLIGKNFLWAFIINLALHLLGWENYSTILAFGISTAIWTGIFVLVDLVFDYGLKMIFWVGDRL